MSVDKIIGEWKKKQFKPIYWIYGEEDYYIDELTDYAEHHILSESEASFNLTVFYGKDAEWSAVINACRRYPMFSERQVVILKEAQQMNSFEMLEPYIQDPLSSTIFMIAYKGKGLDKRKTISKILEKNAVVFQSQKITRQEKVHDWIAAYVKQEGFSIDNKAVMLLEEHLGNDLSRISNEVKKISLNLKDKKTINEDVIEKYVGISKEYNVFELQAAIAHRDLTKAIKIIAYFESNPKSVSIHLAIPTLYAFFSKVYAVFGMSNKSEAAVRPLFYNNPVSYNQGMTAAKNYGYPGVEKIILLLNHYNLKSIGVGDAGSDGAALMKEMVVKMMLK